MVRIRYFGKKRLYLDEERDSIEDYEEDGQIVFFEKVSRRKRIAVVRRLLTPEDFATPVSQDWIDDMFPKRVNY